MRVLIADDQRDVGRSLADLVRCCNHEVVAVVGSGLEAINAYSSLHPDLVLMDYRMPKLNGGTACRHIIAKDPAARVILVSAWSPLDGADQSGALCFLPKPVDLERLDATLYNVAATLPPPSPAEMPIPEICYQPESIDYFPSVAEPLPIDPSSLEITFPVVVPQIQFEQTVAVEAAVPGTPTPDEGVEEKISGKRRSNPRHRDKRARVR